ncbi:unnamed protein product, partial [Brassica oleracea var. botrytis]
RQSITSIDRSPLNCVDLHSPLAIRRFEETIASPSTDETRSTSFDSTGPALIDRHITVLIDIDIIEFIARPK